jgi:hypothetical protein
MRHGERFARAGHTQEHLMGAILVQADNKLIDRLWLIALRLKLRDKFERTFARHSAAS